MSEHTQEKKEIFNEQQPLFDKIKELGFSEYARSLDSLLEYFKPKDKSIRCMDEGTPGGKHSAGSGILREKSEVIQAFRDAGITEVTSHDGCGAAKLYAKAKGLDESKGDEYGKEWSEALAKELGVPYRHISFEEMKRPKEFHISRVAYYDGTGKFDWNIGKDFPPGFIISRKIQSDSDSLAEAGVSLNIAFGDHGFGDLITEENPFIIVAIGEDEESVTFLEDELESLTHEYGNRVITDCFIASK